MVSYKQEGARMKMLIYSFKMICILLIIAGGSRELSAQPRKYQIKSGIITFESVSTTAGTEIKNTIIVFFDDYGLKERRDTLDGRMLKESTFSDGKELFKINHAEKTVYKMGKGTRGTEMKFDWNEVSPRQKKKGNARQKENIKIAGKTCDSFEVMQSKTTTLFAGWNNILLYTDMRSKFVNSITRAVKIEENVTVSPNTFSIPAGYSVQ